MNLTKLDASVTIAPQLRMEVLTAIAHAGFRGIINNRPDGESPDQPDSKELAAKAHRLGLKYWHIPIRPGEATLDDARAFAAAVHQAGGPVLAFFRSGTRSRQLWQLAQQLSRPR
jgi:sulfide:quinone oxidoreductase